MRTKELFNFIKERHAIYERKRSGLPKPWTLDPILQKYKFCNVYRELDTQTQWLANNWRTPNHSDKDFWFAALVFRFINWHETAEELGYPIPWNPQNFISTLAQRKACDKKVYSGAYMISTHGVKQEKHTYLACSLSKIWMNREELRYKKGETLATFHSRLVECFDVGSFLAAQVIADAKYVGIMQAAPDWYIFAASGPGSRRGLNRVCGRGVGSPCAEMQWRWELRHLHMDIELEIAKEGMPPLPAQDLQNCLCEFDKYERVRLGEGRPKSTYPGV